MALLAGDLRADDSAMRLIPMFLNWTNGWLHSRARFAEEREFTHQEDDFFTFDSSIPLLSIKSVDANRETQAVAITAGIVGSLDDSRFFGFTGPPDEQAGPDVRIEAGEPIERTVHGLLLPLSEAWEAVNDNLFVVAQETPRDAALIVETHPLEQLFAPTIGEVARIMLIN